MQHGPTQELNSCSPVHKGLSFCTNQKLTLKLRSWSRVSWWFMFKLCDLCPYD